MVDRVDRTNSDPISQLFKTLTKLLNSPDPEAQKRLKEAARRHSQAAKHGKHPATPSQAKPAHAPKAKPNRAGTPPQAGKTVRPHPAQPHQGPNRADGGRGAKRQPPQVEPPQVQPPQDQQPHLTTPLPQTGGSQAGDQKPPVLAPDNGSKKPPQFPPAGSNPGRSLPAMPTRTRSPNRPFRTRGVRGPRFRPLSRSHSKREALQPGIRSRPCSSRPMQTGREA